MEKTLQTTHKPPLTAFFVDDLPVDTQKKRPRERGRFVDDQIVALKERHRSLNADSSID